MARRWFRRNAAFDDDGLETPTDPSPRPKRWFQKKPADPTDEDIERSSSEPTYTNETSTRSLFRHWGRNISIGTKSSEPEDNPLTVTAGTIVDALYSLMGDEDLSDVRLQGSDGGTVVAVKAILALRSPVFRDQFFGSVAQAEAEAIEVTIVEEIKEGGGGGVLQDAVVVKDAAVVDEEITEVGMLQDDIDIKDTSTTEDDDSHSQSQSQSHSDDDSNSDDISLSDNDDEQLISADGRREMTLVTFEEWDCRILYLIVEFCYTDNLSIMNVKPSDEIARIMANLRSASKAFKIRSLYNKVDQWGFRNISRYPALACAVIDEGIRLDDIDPLAMKTLQLKPGAGLLPTEDGAGSGVLALSRPGLVFVLRQMEDKTSHLLLFHSLQRWVEFSSDRYSYANPAQEKASKMAFASKCAMRFIKLERIGPGKLEEVMSSGLIVLEKSLVPPSTPSVTERAIIVRPSTLVMTQ